MPDQNDTAGEEAAAERDNAVAVFLAKRAVEDLRAVLSMPEGRRWLHQLQRDLLFYESIVAGTGVEFRLGVREAACAIRRAIAKVDPELPARMELEWLQADAERRLPG